MVSNVTEVHFLRQWIAELLNYNIGHLWNMERIQAIVYWFHAWMCTFTYMSKLGSREQLVAGCAVLNSICMHLRNSRLCFATGPFECFGLAQLSPKKVNDPLFSPYLSYLRHFRIQIICISSFLHWRVLNYSFWISMQKPWHATSTSQFSESLRISRENKRDIVIWCSLTFYVNVQLKLRRTH